MKKLMILAVAAMVLASCTDRLTDFTVISTKNYPIGNAEAAAITKADKRVKGVDKRHIILCFPFGTPNMKQAIDRAIEAYPGAIGLADGVVKSKYWWALLYGQSSYIVEGTPIYPNTGAAAGNANYQTTSNSAQQGSALLFFHEVKSGETLADIAKTYGVSISDIIRWNGLSSTAISPGTKLKVQLQ